MGCASTGNTTGRLSEPGEDDEDEVNAGGVPRFLFFTGWLLPDALLICLVDGTLPPSISNMASSILLNYDFWLFLYFWLFLVQVLYLFYFKTVRTFY